MTSLFVMATAPRSIEPAPVELSTAELGRLISPRRLPLRANHRRLVELLGRHVAMTRAQLAARAALPATTVSRLVKELMEAGIVREGSSVPHHRHVGRPERNLRLVGPGGVLALIALSHADVGVALGDFDGVVRHGVVAPLPQATGAASISDRWVEMLGGVLGGRALRWQDVAAVVVSLPMPLRRSANARAEPWPPGSPLLSSAHQEAVDRAVPELARRLQVPVLGENDANLGALGEAIFGPGRGVHSIVYLKMVHGIGMGLVIDGKIHTGARGIAGEFAHVSVDPQGPRCFCGGYGCLVVTTGHFFQRILRSTYGATITLAEAVQLAEKGDLRAQSALEEVGRTLGRPLGGFCTLLDPGAIVVDGALEGMSRYVIAGLEQMTHRYASLMDNGMAVLSGGLGHDAEFYGSIALFRQKYVEALCATE
jgi:predicted NBD/HSP70 family sugar kinase